MHPLRDMTPSPPTPSSKVRAAALGGVIGPTAFIGAWTVGAVVTTRDYSSIDDAISRLASVGADTRALMTAGFVGFGVALPVYASALRRVVGGPAWLCAAATGLATLGVAATPLEHSATVDTWHAVAAGIGYATLAATPLLAARPLLQHGHRALAAAGVVAGSVSTIALALTTTRLPTGLFQRLGLTATDIWVATSGIAIASGRLRAIPPDIQGHR
ncbi:MAG TPA: DUF998 domain-containing protein [Ilumatobacteraceae bacterium]|nr:DUF998 domain-containing protein [Ilumatobacteraceae bacterium]